MRRRGLSGAENEAGGLYRACVAAYFCTHLLRGLPVRELDLPADCAIPTTVELEADSAVDDIALRLSGGGVAYIQSKRSLTLGTTQESTFGEVTTQWRQVAIEEALDPSRDRVGVVTSRLGRPLSDLSAALARGRWSVAASRSEREEASHSTLRVLLDGLDDGTTDALLRCAVVIGLDVESETGTTAQLAQQMLENGVVAVGDGAKAWKALCDECRRRSAVRRGLDMSDLIRVLREAEVDLTSDRLATGSARRAARDEAVAVYRARLVSRGQELDLTGLGAHLPPVPLAAADAITRVERSKGDRPRERQLTWSLRRHGRLLMTGPPGGGKSTTLRASAADFARRDDWPFPVFAKLTDVAKELPRTSFHDALFTTATATLDLSTPQTELVREAFDEALQDGRAALFLDALDETRSERHETVQRVRQFLDAVHPDVEVVVTTREAAYAAAATLGLREVAVVAPLHPERSVRKILDVAAGATGIAEPDQDAWVSERERWVNAVLERDRTLSRTPLIPVVLAVLASKSETSTLPNRRAEILRLVLEDVVRTWEAGQRLQGNVAVGVLEGARAVEALLLAMPLIGAQLSASGSAPRDALEADVSAALAEAFTLARGDAVAAASEVIAFWDEAGVFVAASDGTVSPRLRLFAEIAAAARMAELPRDGMAVAVDTAAGDANQFETIKLASGLSPEVGGAVWEVASSQAGDQLLLTLAGAVAEGADLPSDALDGLALRLVALIEESESWPAAVALARIPVPMALRDEIRERTASVLKDGRLLIFRALSTVCWAESGASADESLRAILQAERPKSRSWTVDDGYADALIGAAERLRGNGGADLDLIEGALGKSSMGVDEKLTAILIDGGRNSAVSAYYGRFTSRFRAAGLFKEWSESNVALLEALGAGREGGHSLTYRQTRRLDELSDFCATLRLPDASGVDIARAVSTSREEVFSLISHIAPLTGLDVDAVSAEAHLVRDVLDTEDGSSTFMMLFDDGVDRGLESWDRVADAEHLRGVLRSHLAGWRWLALPSALALASTPDREVAALELEAVFDDYELWNRQLAGRLLLHLDPRHVDRATEWISSDDVIRRIVAGEDLAASFENEPGLRALVEKALADPDEGVRAATFSGLSPNVTDDGLRSVAWSEVQGDATGWFCITCGHTNKADASGCESCSTSGPDAAKAARELLEAVGEDVPAVRDHIRRHVKVFNLDEHDRP